MIQQVPKRPISSIIKIAVVGLLLALSLTSCGKRNDPIAPTDKPASYPQSYPTK